MVLFQKVFATRQICGKYKFSFQQSFLKMQLRKFSSDLKWTCETKFAPRWLTVTQSDTVTQWDIVTVIKQWPHNVLFAQLNIWNKSITSHSNKRYEHWTRINFGLFDCKNEQWLRRHSWIRGETAYGWKFWIFWCPNIWWEGWGVSRFGTLCKLIPFVSCHIEQSKERYIYWNPQDVCFWWTVTFGAAWW